MAKDLLGGFEHRVLLAALALGDGAYTASIVDELERRTGREAAPSAVFIALQRLERRGLVESEVRTDEKAGDLRPRRYFRTAEEAKVLLREEQRELKALWGGLERAGEV